MQEEFEIKLRNAKSDQKQYWKLYTCTVSEFYNFFKNINSRTDSTEIDLPNITYSIQELDHEISDAEIIKVAKSLKNKFCGEDGVFNEYNKTTIGVFLPLYKLFFNHILSLRVIPESWVYVQHLYNVGPASSTLVQHCINVIQMGNGIPIYKNKGDEALPEIYRGITILSCFGEFFTSLINLRLNNFIESHNIMPENQEAFTIC